MATVKPRITVTLSPAAHLALKRLGELTSQSQSAMVGELVESSLPVFLRVIQVMEAANRAKDSVTTDMRDSLHRAQERIEGHLAQVLDHMEEGYAPILAIDQEAAQRATEAAPPTPVGGALPWPWLLLLEPLKGLELNPRERLQGLAAKFVVGVAFRVICWSQPPSL